jgi:hypothetical protein
VDQEPALSKSLGRKELQTGKELPQLVDEKKTTGKGSQGASRLLWLVVPWSKKQGQDKEQTVEGSVGGLSGQGTIFPALDRYFKDLSMACKILRTLKVDGYTRALASCTKGYE